jgi:plastocyanin
MIGIARRRPLGGWRMAALVASFTFVAAGVTCASETTVMIDNFTFKPEILAIRQGSKVTFVNHDDIPHSVVDSGGKFRSKVLDTDESFSITFNTIGDVTYFCGLHPHMKGRITITP